MQTVYLVLTNVQSWGRGDDFAEAFEAALEQGGDPGEMHVYRIERHDTGFHATPLIDNVYVNDMGGACWPIDAVCTKLTNMPCSGIVERYRDFKGDCEAVEDTLETSGKVQ